MIVDVQKKYHFGDELEKELAECLELAGIRFIHSSEGGNQRLDFYLPDFDVFIEVKKFHSERSNDQLSSKDNIILIQGRESIDLFCKILRAEK